jgi:hypothetical protein
MDEAKALQRPSPVRRPDRPKGKRQSPHAGRCDEMISDTDQVARAEVGIGENGIRKNQY